MPESFSQRGFATYVSFLDSYGARVAVAESSAAQIEGEEEGPWVWIFAVGGSVAENDGSAHLGPQEALRVRNALHEWLQDHMVAAGLKPEDLELPGG